MSKLFAAAKKFFSRKEEGATMVEYGIMVVLIAAVCVAIITTLGTQVSSAFNAIVTTM
jgi:pilus assembly protein Flp/PilA